MAMKHREAVEVASEVSYGGFESTSSFTDASEAVAAELSDSPKGVFDMGADAALLPVLTHSSRVLCNLGLSS